MLGTPRQTDTRPAAEAPASAPSTSPNLPARNESGAPLPSEWWHEWKSGNALRQQAQRVFSLPSALFLMARWCGVGIIFSVALSWWIFATLSVIPQTLLILYGALIGLGLGATWGAVRVVDLAMDSIWQLVVMVFEGIESALAEVDSLRRGKLSANGLQTLSHTLYQGIFFPVVRRAARQAAGVFARPVTWALDKTIARLIERMLPAPTPEPSSTRSSADGAQAMQAGTALESLSAAHSRLLSLRNKTRTIALTPLVVLATVNSLLMTAPVAAIYLLLR